MLHAVTAREIRRALATGMTLAGMALAVLAPSASPLEAKTPGKRYCYGDVCHRVLNLKQTIAEIGKIRSYYASHYGNCEDDDYNPCGLTSSGEEYRPDRPDSAASAIHPDGTVLLIRNPANGLTALVRVNNFGPFWGNRKLDVSRTTAKRLRFVGKGVAKLDVMVVHAPTAAEARYKRYRRYAPVAGFVGETKSIESAYLDFLDKREKARIAQFMVLACGHKRPKRMPRLQALDVTSVPDIETTDNTHTPEAATRIVSAR